MAWATPGLGVASVYKVLHHKRPYLFPLLDNQTLRLLKPAARVAGWRSVDRAAG